MTLFKTNIAREELSSVLSNALNQKGLLEDEDTSVIFYDLSFLKERISRLKAAFPEGTLHTVAVKANPLIETLKELKEFGVGLEVASGPELFFAIKLGFAPNKIVFDSPAKTFQEIEYALSMGVTVNADSFEELERIDSILKIQNSSSRIGARINPQVGAGSIKATSVADNISKFGIPLNDNYNKLVEYYQKYPWLTGVHVHIGSQGCPVPLLIDGIQKVVDFALKVNAMFQVDGINRKIEVVDIGGGLPVSYYPDKPAISIEDYYQLLNQSIPELFCSGFRVTTEFGRYIHANTGWAVSRVEYVKREKGYNIAMIHLGADFMLRKCYNPDDWHHEITVLDPKGSLKTGKDLDPYIIAGPLCFAGDVIADNLDLPIVETGDYIIIHDIGAYTLSMWSRYNSRQIPKVVGYENTREFRIMKPRENMDQILEFWT